MPDDRKPPVKRKTAPYGVDLTGDARDRYVPKHDTPELAAPHDVPEEKTDSHNVWDRYQRAKNHSAMLKLHAEKIETISTDVTELRVDAAHKTGQLDTLLRHTLKQTDTLADITRMTAASAAKRADTATDLEAHRVKWWRKVWFKVLATLLTAIAAAIGIIAKGCG